MNINGINLNLIKRNVPQCAKLIIEGLGEAPDIVIAN